MEEEVKMRRMGLNHIKLLIYLFKILYPNNHVINQACTDTRITYTTYSHQKFVFKFINYCDKGQWPSNLIKNYWPFKYLKFNTNICTNTSHENKYVFPLVTSLVPLVALLLLIFNNLTASRHYFISSYII